MRATERCSTGEGGRVVTGGGDVPGVDVHPVQVPGEDLTGDRESADVDAWGGSGPGGLLERLGGAVLRPGGHQPVAAEDGQGGRQQRTGQREGEARPV